MPVVITFDVKKAGKNEHNRIQSFFERLGWESLGGTSYRYPRLGSEEPVEDWFNHVVPALMLFRQFVLKATKKGRRFTKFTLDIQSSSGYNIDSKYGTPPTEGNEITLYKPEKYTHFGEKNLRQWLGDIEYPY